MLDFFFNFKRLLSNHNIKYSLKQFVCNSLEWWCINLCKCRVNSIDLEKWRKEVFSFSCSPALALAPFSTPHADTKYVLVSERQHLQPFSPGRKRGRIFHRINKRLGGRKGGEGEFYLSALPLCLVLQLTNRLFTSSSRSSAQPSAQPALCGVTKCSSCHPRETEHICSEMFAAFPDLGHGNLRTFPNPGLISLIQLDY